MQAAASIMDNEPTVSENDDLEWGGEFSEECTEREDCLHALSNTRPIVEKYKEG